MKFLSKVFICMYQNLYEFPQHTPSFNFNHIQNGQKAAPAPRPPVFSL